MAVGLGGEAHPKDVAQVLRGNGRSVVGYAERERAGRLVDGQQYAPVRLPRVLQQRVPGVVDQVAQHAAHLPARHAQRAPAGADGDLQRDAPFGAVLALGGDQRVDGGNGGLQHAAGPLDVAVHALHVFHGLGLVAQLHQRKHDLQMVHEIVALAAQRAVQVLQLAIGLLQHARLVGDALGVHGLADVQRGAPAHDDQRQRQRDDLDLPVDVAVQRDVEQHRDDGAHLDRVDDHGEARRLFDVQLFAG